ncbi:MAG: hypothetical protein ACLFNU_07385 [Bacteroidales bacterium]
MVLIRKKKNDLFQWLENPSQELLVLLNDIKPKSKGSTEPQQPVKKVDKPTVSEPSVVTHSKVKTFSIKDAIEGKPSQAKDKDINEETLTYSNEEDEADDASIDAMAPFTQVDLENACQKFIDSYLSDKPRYASLLITYQPSVENGNDVIVGFDSQLQVDMFSEIKNDLLVFLKKKLDNNAISIETSIKAQEEQKNKLYTVEDKFKYLSDLNPELIRLKQQLNLDFD